MAQKTLDSANNRDPFSHGDLQKLLELLKTLRFGSVTLIVQDGKVVQIDKNEKMRLI